MRPSRQRNDHEDTLYKISNRQAGREGENGLAPQCRTQLLRLANRLSKLYVVRMTLLQVSGDGYSLLLAAPAALPSRQTVEARFHAYYRKNAPLPDLDDPALLRHWAERLRDISAFIKDLEQMFTVWLNQVKHRGKRHGTSWRDRFKSVIIGSARRIFAALDNGFGDGVPRLGRAHCCHGPLAQSAWHRFWDRHPLLAEVLVDTGEVGAALCQAMATGTVWPIRCALRRC
ncbi:MAG: hypothetical protein WC708_06080 [Lentisphaeria bacterium]